MKDKVRILALGGQAESGKSMYSIEINGDIYVVEAGFKYPDNDVLGVDIIIPDFSYLVKNKKKIKGIFITHGHDNVLAALPYLCQQIDAPIFASSLTADIIEDNIAKYNKNVKRSFQKVNTKVIRIKTNGTVYLDNMNVWFFAMTHEIPGNVGVAFDTPKGFIVFASEFIIDFGAPENFQADLLRMTEIGKKGVLCLLGESSGANRRGYTSPQHKITDKVANAFEENNGRIILALGEQNYRALYEVVDLVVKNKKRVVFYNRNDINQHDFIMGNKVRKHGDIKTKRPIIYVPPVNRANIEDIKKEENDDLVVVLLGSVKTLFNDIVDIVNGVDEHINLCGSDTFIMATTVTPVSEIGHSNAQNELFKSDANLVMLKAKQIMTSHASIEDLKMLFKVFNPKYYVPIKGEYNQLVANKEVALSMGMKSADVPIIDNGEIISIVNGELKATRDIVETDSVMIDGIGVGDVGSKVIDDRVMLAGNGVVIAGITIDKNTKEVIANPDIQTRGFVYMKSAQDVINECATMYEEIVNRRASEDTEFDSQEVRLEARDTICKYLYKKTGKKPVVLTVILEV